MNGTDADPSRDQLMQEAAAWFARMRGPDAESSKEEFEAWLRRGALHRQAYNRASEIFAMGKVLADADGQAAPTTAPQSGGRRPRRLLLGAIASLLVFVAAGWLVLKVVPLGEPGAEQVTHEEAKQSPPAQLLRTAAGQMRTSRLADGSLIILQGDSLLEVRMGTSERRLDLRRGQARFQVAHEQRPFVVRAGGGSVTAHGTVFDVGITTDRRVTVRLIEGAVDVAFPSGTARDPQPAPTRRLRPGQSLTYAVSSAQATVPVSTGASEKHAPVEAPQSAREYDGVAVADLVAAANRGSAQPIQLADTAIGQRRVSGRFRVDNTALLAQRLALLFDLTVDRSRPEEIVLRAR